MPAYILFGCRYLFISRLGVQQVFLCFFLIFFFFFLKLIGMNLSSAFNYCVRSCIFMAQKKKKKRIQIKTKKIIT